MVKKATLTQNIQNLWDIDPEITGKGIEDCSSEWKEIYADFASSLTDSSKAKVDLN